MTFNSESSEIIANARADYYARIIDWEQYADIIFAVMKAEVEARYPDTGLQPCGHPASSVVQDDEGKDFCGECEDNAKFEQHKNGVAL